MSKVINGDTVSLHYKGTLGDGTEFDNSHKRGELLTFQVGSGQMIPGFEEEILGAEKGEKRKFSLEPDKAYGQHDPAAIQIAQEALVGIENNVLDFLYQLIALIKDRVKYTPRHMGPAWTERSKT